MRALVVMVLGLIACDAGAPPPMPAPARMEVAKPVPIEAKVKVPEPNLPEAPVAKPPAPPAPKATVAQHDPGAIIVIIDRSGSMMGPKLEAAKESARVVAEVLEPTDELGVIAFDSEATIVAPLQKDSAKKAIQAAIGTIASGGGTNILPALRDAVEALRGSKAKRKHIVLLTDGEAPYDGIPELLKNVEADHITVSTVGVQGADRNLLAMISDAGQGRLYMVEDIGSLPKIFLKEVKEAFKR